MREWNLSFECLTGVAARSKLRSLRDTDSNFWEELTSQNTIHLPAKDNPQPEDDPTDVDPIDELDDSEVQIEDLIESMVMNNVPEGYQVSAAGGLETKAEAESFEEVQIVKDADDGDKEIGRGKRVKQSNRLYKDFWQHN